MYIRLLKNGAEGIIEPFYDGGESYRENEKYSTLVNYTTTPADAAEQGWATANFKIMPKKTVISERNCNIDIERFDEIYILGKVPKTVTIKVVINGREIISECGKGDNAEYRGKLQENIIKNICMLFESISESVEAVNLWYIGVRDSKFISSDKLKGECTYPDWEGCFLEIPEIKPCTNVFVSELEADELREKMKSDEFRLDYITTKKNAEKYMNSIPEKSIGRVVNFIDGAEPYYAASTLAFIGFIEKDINMLKMAARYALSLACDEYWCLTEKETVPGITWHHRSFSESYCAYGISVVLEFAGSIMTWHGRNILYDALIMKGLPRMDADFKTMEYIYHMNQGLAFSTGYAYSLITLAKRYPRYKKRVLEIEEDINEMIEKCINPDGGMFEGPGYWDYTMQMYLNTACILSKYHGQSIAEYVGHKTDKTSDFALIMANENNQMRTVGDCGRRPYNSITSYFLAEITQNPKWIKFVVNERKKPQGNNYGGLGLCYLIFAKNNTIIEKKLENKDIFINLPDTGYTYLKRGDDEFFAISGRSFSHCHPDKGSFMIDYKGDPVLIDRGMCRYDEGEADKISESRAHNMAVPVVDGIVMCQNSQHGYGAEILKSEYKDGKFIWISNNNNVWDKTIVKKNIRTIYSDRPFQYIVTDEFEFTKAAKVMFNLNMYDNKHIEAEPIDWIPEKSEYVEYYTDYEKKPVMQQRLISKEGVSIKITTKIIIKE